MKNLIKATLTVFILLAIFSILCACNITKKEDVPNEPPALRVQISYLENGTTVTNELDDLYSKKYNWNGTEVNDEWFLTRGFINDYGYYKISLTPLYCTDDIKSISVSSYAGIPNSRASVDFTFENDTIRFDLTPGLTYTVAIEFEYGLVEYHFNTHIMIVD